MLGPVTIIKVLLVVIRTAVVAEHRVPFGSKQDVGRTRTADTAEPLDIAPVLVDEHQPGDAEYSLQAGTVLEAAVNTAFRTSFYPWRTSV